MTRRLNCVRFFGIFLLGALSAGCAKEVHGQNSTPIPPSSSEPTEVVDLNSVKPKSIELRCVSEVSQPHKIIPEKSEERVLVNEPVVSIEMTRLQFLQSIHSLAQKCGSKAETSIKQFLSDLPKKTTFTDLYAAYWAEQLLCDDVETKPLSEPPVDEIPAFWSEYLLDLPFCRGRKGAKYTLIKLKGGSSSYLGRDEPSVPYRLRDEYFELQRKAMHADQFMRFLLANGFETLEVPKLTKSNPGPFGPSIPEHRNHFAVCGPDKAVCFYMRFSDNRRRFREVLARPAEALERDYYEFSIDETYVFLME